MKTLVCLSGSLCDQRLWKSQQQVLQKHYQCVFPSISTCQEIQELAQQILKSLPKSFCLMGMSAGAVVALEILRQVSKHHQQEVEKLVLVAGNPHAVNETHKQNMIASVNAMQKTGIEFFLRQTLLPESLSATNLNKTSIQETVIDMANSIGLEEYTNQVAMLNTRVSSLELLQKTHVPVLAVCGEEDNKCPATLHEDLAKSVSHYQLVTLPKTGHYINLESPDLLNEALLQFLT